jgi:hypothetical protein
MGWLSFAIAVGVCAAQTLPPNLGPSPSPAPTTADPTAARVSVLVGDVSVLKDSYPWVLKVGDTVKVQQVIISGPDSYAVFELSDGSRFEVFPNSRLTFRSNPGDWRDLLDLYLGQVKVFIQRLGGQPNPHRIFTPTAVISVRGTVFGVAVEDDDDTTLVSVDEGQVAVRHRLIGESNEKLVSAGEYLRVYKDAPLAHSLIDKGSVFQKVARSAAEAMYTVLLNRGAGAPSAGGGSGVPGGTTAGGGGPTLPGDTGGTTPPPPGDPAPPTGPPPPPPPGG